MTRLTDGSVASIWTTVDGWPVHARRVGDGRPVVVCVHGVGVSSRYMVPYMRALDGIGTVYALDLPGFGLSRAHHARVDVRGMADALIAWIAAVDAGPVVVVGNSAGCQVAVDAAVRAPERIRRLVLVGPTVDSAARTAASQVWRWVRNAVYESPRQLPIIVRDYRDAGVRRMVANFRAVLEDRIEATLPSVAAPTLVIRGSRDRIVPQAWAEEVTRLLPQGRLTVIRGAAHAVNFSHPRELAGVTRPFLRESV